MKFVTVRMILGGSTLVSLLVILALWPYRSYTRQRSLWGYEVHDFGRSPGADYEVLYLGALGGKHTVYHGGCISNGVVGVSINLPNRSEAYEPRPAIASYTVLPVNPQVLDIQDQHIGGIVYGINSQGQATGVIGKNALYFSGGTVTALKPPPGFEKAEARGINAGSVVAGFCDPSGEEAYLRQHATIWKSGTPTDIGVPEGCVSSRCNGINDAGQIAITAITKAKRTRSYRWQDGKFEDLGSLGGVATVAQAINNRGQIVGTSEVSPKIFHAFLWEEGAMVDLGSLSKNHTYVKATSINNKGEVVGWSGIGEGWNSTTRPFVWDKVNGMRDLTKLVGYMSPFQPRTAYSIDENGDILVYGYRKQFWNTVQALAILRKTP
ncbi:MAG: hypothetical protein WCK51_05785 [Armatimonadota bacterium]